MDGSKWPTLTAGQLTAAPSTALDADWWRLGDTTAPSTALNADWWRLADTAAPSTALDADWERLGDSYYRLDEGERTGG